MADTGFEYLTITRQQEIEMPSTVEVVFINKALDYQQGHQYARRLTTNSLETKTITVPIVMSDTEAKELAERLLYVGWQERLIYSFKLPNSFLYLEPTDIVELVDEKYSYKLRIIKKTETPDGIEFNGVSVSTNIKKGVSRSGGVYTMTGFTTGSYTNNQELSEESPLSEAIILDLPCLLDSYSDDYVIYYSATALGPSGWRGASIFRTVDDIEYTSIGAVTTQPAKGYLTTTLENSFNSRRDILDEHSVFEVYIENGVQLYSAADFIDLMTGKNIAIVNGEIIRFMTADLIAENTYRIYGLLRGQFGTFDKISSIKEYGTDFVVLDSDSGAYLPLTIGDIGNSIQLKAVSFDRTLTESDLVTTTYNGRNFKRLPPTTVKAVNKENTDWKILYTPQERAFYTFNNNGPQTLIDQTDSHIIKIKDGATTVRTITGSSVLATAFVTYTAANQVADFGSVQSSITFTISRTDGSTINSSVEDTYSF